MGAKREGLLSRVWRALFGRKPDSVVDESSASADPGSPRVAPELIMTQEASSPAHIPTEHAVPSSAGRDRAVRVFVSSTFRDRVEDRNALMAQVWPALRKLCREWSVEFVEVDLRWGITEEISQRAETLRHCPAEIRRCRPYFIGLLGERNGWVPGPDSYTEALLQEERWLEQEIARHSVTELEMLHGVLNDPAMAGRAFFYFRDPAYTEGKGPDYQPEDEANAQRQQALKERIRTVCRVQRIALREGDDYRDPDTLTQLVLAGLTAAIDAEFPADQVPDVWVREARDHEAYARSRRTRFSPNERSTTKPSIPMPRTAPTARA